MLGVYTLGLAPFLVLALASSYVLKHFRKLHHLSRNPQKVGGFPHYPEWESWCCWKCVYLNKIIWIERKKKWKNGKHVSLGKSSIRCLAACSSKNMSRRVHYEGSEIKTEQSQLANCHQGSGGLLIFELTGVDGKTCRLSWLQKARKSILNSGLLGVPSV